MATDNPDNATPDGAAVVAAARAGEPDRYLAALLAPASERAALLALAAFAAELGRIPRLVVREPLMGEVRLQWWRDAVLGLAEDRHAGHSVADAVRHARRCYDLPAPPLDGMIDGRAMRLTGGPFEDERALQDFLWQTEGALFAMAARVVGLPPGADLDTACRASGHAYGLARLLFELPRSLAHGHIPLAQAHIAQAGLTAEELLAGAGGAKVAAVLGTCHAQIRASLGNARRFAQQLPRGARIAFLPLALVEPYVRALERAGGRSLREEARIVPLTRVLRIAAAYLFGRL